MSVKEIRTELIRLAAELVTGKDAPSYFSEDHSPRRSRAYWLKQLELAEEIGRNRGIRLKAVADKLLALNADEPAAPDDATVREAFNTALSIAQGVCPNCGNDDLHRASIDGEDGVECTDDDCNWTVTYATLKKVARRPTQPPSDTRGSEPSAADMANAGAAKELAGFRDAFAARDRLIEMEQEALHNRNKSQK